MREKKEINIHVGEQVRIAREQAKLTQEALAEIIDVSPQFVSDLERGVVGISLATLKRLSGALDVTSDQILFGTHVQDRSLLLAKSCEPLTDDQFSALMEMVNCFIKAMKLRET